MIGALLLFQGYDRKTIVYALSYGVLVGGVMQVIAHLFALKKENFFKFLALGFKYRHKRDAALEESNKRFNRSFWHSVIGNSTPQIVSFVDTTLASFLVTGSISYLYYGNRIFQLPLALFAIALTTGIFPRISRLIKANKEEEASNLLSQGFWILAFLLTTSTLGGFMLSDEIVKLLFEHGSFSSQDSANTGFVLAMYMIGLIPFGLAKLFSLWLYAGMRQREAAIIAMYSLIANLIFSFSLIKPMGAAGLALAGSLSAFVLLFFTLRSFGRAKFFAILYNKKLVILIILLIVEWGVLHYVKELMHVYL